MIEDKTYLVIISNRKNPKVQPPVWDVELLYVDNAVDSFNLDPIQRSTESIFKMYWAADGSQFTEAIELPASVKTSTSEMQYFFIEPMSGIIRKHTAAEADMYAKSLQRYRIEDITVTNKTNADIKDVSQRSVIVGLPLPAKDVSHHILTNLI